MPNDEMLLGAQGEIFFQLLIHDFFQESVSSESENTYL